MVFGVELWQTFEPKIVPLLSDEDDPALWRAVVDIVHSDAMSLCRLIPDSWAIVTQLGRCSHWLGPHQTRWTADGGFACPTGYDGGRLFGLPGFDWFQEWSWSRNANCWVVGDVSARRVVFRVAVPSRSRLHQQAAVHTIWQPSTPFHVAEKVMQFYGFRQQMSGSWACTAYRSFQGSTEKLYERAALKAGSDGEDFPVDNDHLTEPIESGFGEDAE